MTSNRIASVLSGLTVVGLALAALDVFILPGVWGPIGLLIVYGAGGIPATLQALSELWRQRALDIDLLMVLAAVAAAAVGAPFEGAVLLTLFSLSTTLEKRAMGKAQQAVEALMALRPATALRRLPSGEIEEVPVESIVPGDILVLRPGARVPVDGTILEGTGELDESTVTGESLPVEKTVDDPVFEATVNLGSVLLVQATKATADSTVARMIALVTQAQAERAPSSRFSEWFGHRYTIAVLVGAILAFGFFLLTGNPFNDALYRAATLLVAASPCAIVISVPAAILSALAAAARGGVLFKGGAALETLARVDVFAFDKTGTLTSGRLEITSIYSQIPESEFLSLITGLEAQSEHHIATAIRKLAKSQGIQPHDVHDARTLPSEGMVGTSNGGECIWAGNVKLVKRMGADITAPEFRGLGDREQSIIWVGRDNQVLGGIHFEDQLRPSSLPALQALKKSGVKQVVMMTGDRKPTACRIGKELQVSPDDVHAELLPEDKVRLVAMLTQKGTVAFVGDGVNDAAALARADVGIAMGAAGSDVALRSADIALMSEDMERIAAAHHLAKRTRQVILQNLTFALGVMIILVLTGLFFDLPLPLAVIGHEGGTLAVVLNGLRLLNDPIRRASKPKRRPSKPQSMKRSGN